MERRYGSVERSDRSSSLATTVMTSAVSSIGTDPWTTSGFLDDDEAETDRMDGEMLLKPKPEPTEHDGVLAEVDEAPAALTLISLPMPAKRPRGRPRKHPLPDPNAISKVAKGRSKTGCITCRRRKKKCDETKPACINCEKNAFVCEGYPSRTVWKSGKEKQEEARKRRVSFSYVKLEPIIRGVESAEDKVFFEHYARLSSLFTAEREIHNPFKDMLLPLAVKHLGLMHSILSLSSKHIDYESSYGQHLLESHRVTSIEEVRKRSQYHADEAMKELHAGIAKEGNDEVEVSARFGQMLCLVLQTLSDPAPAGEHRVHLQAYASLIQQSPPKPGPFLDFIQEFFQYHIALDELIYLPRLTPPSMNSPTTPPPYDFDWDHCTTFQSCTVHLLGVSDGLFRYMSQITSIRDRIRQNMHNDVDPIVDYTSLYQAANIDAGIRDWSPVWPPGDSRDLTGLLYKQMMWVYLWRTIYPPKTTTWTPDKRITQAVNDGIAMLKEVSQQDTTQTLLLAPAFVLGCAAFEKEQREPIRNAIAAVKEYRQLKNADTALKLLEEVWRLMDEKDERSWDWQAVAKSMGLDFLVT